MIAQLPPLREQAGDIPLLAQAFLKRYAGERLGGFDPETLAVLEANRWRATCGSCRTSLSGRGGRGGPRRRGALFDQEVRGTAMLAEAAAALFR